MIALQEVENLDTLKRFRSEYLGGSRGYPFALAIDGNDPRLIDVAVLSKHPIVHARSYAHLREGSSALFSRDCLEVDVLVDRKRLTLFVQQYKSMMGGARRRAHVARSRSQRRSSSSRTALGAAPATSRLSCSATSTTPC